MIEALQNFSMAYSYFAAGKLEVDFKGGETLMRWYSAERGEWLNQAKPMPAMPEIHKELVFQDELLRKRLQMKARNGVLLEIDLVYLPTPIQEKKEETPYFPRLLLLFDHNQKRLLGQKLLDKKNKSEEAVSNALIDYVDQYGKPNKILVRDKYFLNYVDSLCSQLEIPAEFDKGVPCVDEFAEEMAGFLEEK